MTLTARFQDKVRNRKADEAAAADRATEGVVVWHALAYDGQITAEGAYERDGAVAMARHLHDEKGVPAVVVWEVRQVGRVLVHRKVWTSKAGEVTVVA